MNRLKGSVRLDWGHSDEQYQKREEITQNLHWLKCSVRLGYALGHADHQNLGRGKNILSFELAKRRFGLLRLGCALGIADQQIQKRGKILSFE